jgi:hypothetical protein
VAVAVRFAKAVIAHDVAGYSACESTTVKPSADMLGTLATSGPLLFDRAAAVGGGNSVNIPMPDEPNGDLPPHVCGITVNGQFESGGWFVTDVIPYCSA